MNLSIITINYNDAIGLKKTMSSVESQTWQEFEHIIVDGKSTDSSVEVIKSFDYKNLIWLSEEDDGIYNAMNKGIKKSNGKYLLFLNSGDYLFNENVLLNVQNNFDENNSFICGNMYYENEGKLTIRKHPDLLTFSYLIAKTISHPSTFILSSMFDKYGLYNEELKIISDWEFFLKCLGLNGESYKKLDEDITIFNINGISSNEENLSLVKQEKEEVLKKYMPTVFSNEEDIYIFNHFKETSKRFKYLRVIDKSPFFRKMATAMLMTNSGILKIVKKLGL